MEPEKSNSAGHVESVSSAYREARDFNKRGLFIGGCPKSGTTLLLALLDGHPQLAVLPEETAFLEDRREYLTLKTHQAKLRRLLEKTELRLLANGWFEPEREGNSADARNYTHFDCRRFVALAEALTNQPWMNDALLFSETIRAYAMVLGADWRNCLGWVEKTPSNAVCPDALDELFPDARLIQLVRDPRAVFASRKKRLLHRCGCYAKAHRLVREWNHSSREIPRLRRNPSRFLVIRYEDLVKNPEEVMRKVCRLGGFDFSERLLEPTRAGRGWQCNSSFQQTLKGITATPVDQWKDYLTEQEVWWIEMHCRKGMELANYPLQTDGRFSLWRWLKRLPGESWSGYVRARRGSLYQLLGLLRECRYDK